MSDHTITTKVLHDSPDDQEATVALTDGLRDTNPHVWSGTCVGTRVTQVYVIIMDTYMDQVQGQVQGQGLVQGRLRYVGRAKIKSRVQTCMPHASTHTCISE